MGRQQFERLLLKRQNKPQAAQTSFFSATIIEHVAYLVKEIIYPLILKKRKFSSNHYDLFEERKTDTLVWIKPMNFEKNLLNYQSSEVQAQQNLGD